MVDGPTPTVGSDTGRRRPTATPPAVLRSLEGRAFAEWGAFVATAPALRRASRAPATDAPPVLVLPGFTASDRSTRPLRSILRSQGHHVHGWRLGRNLGPTPKVLDGLVDRLRQLAEAEGTPVRLVGWSLGGMYARMLARHHPDLVDQVVMLGSPFRVRSTDRTTASPLAARLSDRFGELPDEVRTPEPDLPPLTVPSTAIYSRSDGVARWHLCIEAEGPLRENIEVRSSHTGLGWNPAVVVAVGDRLSRPRGEPWVPFVPPRNLRHLYPTPAWWRPDA